MEVVINKVDNLLITGCAGFIGMHLCKSLLEDGYEVFGIDNMNDYYDPVLKEARLKELSIYDNFQFQHIDISQRNEVQSIFKRFNPSKVVNLAAQAGVRYSLQNPGAYIQSNIIGFLNVLEGCRDYEVEGLIYASSSSVYGGNKKIPFSEHDLINNPISIYATSKISNELMANTFNHLYGLNTTGLRYFTAYGPWGRPDMAIYIFTEKIIKGEPINVFNNGKMKRDFTYIDDIIQGTRASIEKNYRNEIFNLGRHRSENLLTMIEYIEKYLNIKANINYMDIEPGDVKTTFADIKYSKKMLGYSPKTSISEGIPRFISWYKSYNKIGT